MAPQADGSERKTDGASGHGLGWLAIFTLTIPAALVVWRIGGLGFGDVDLAPHFLLDLLVTACVVPLLSGPLRGRPPLPAVYGAVLVLLSLYVGWLYLPAGVGTAGLLFLVTLGLGVFLRLLREKLSVATFLRSNLMEESGLTVGEVPADAVYAHTSSGGGHTHQWRRYIALPVIAGLFLGFLAVRVTRPLDKRAEARAVLAQGEPFEIGRAFLKAAVNGNAPLFIRERVTWFVKPAARGEVLGRAHEFFGSYREQVDRLELRWIDLGTLEAVDGREGNPNGIPERVVQTYGGRALAWLNDPESPPGDLAWVDAERPWRGFQAWVGTVKVALEKTAGGWRVVDMSAGVQIGLRKP